MAYDKHLEYIAETQTLIGESAHGKTVTATEWVRVNFYIDKSKFLWNIKKMFIL